MTLLHLKLALEDGYDPLNWDIGVNMKLMLESFQIAVAIPCVSQVDQYVPNWGRLHAEFF